MESGFRRASLSLVILLNSICSYAQADLSDVRARYANLDEQRVGRIRDMALPRFYDDYGFMESSKVDAIREYKYCEEKCDKTYLLRFIIDWPLYKETGKVNLILDPFIDNYNILYVDQSAGDYSVRSILFSYGSKYAEIQRTPHYLVNVFNMAFAREPQLILSFEHSFYSTFVFVINDILFCYHRGIFCRFDDYISSIQSYLESTYEETKREFLAGN